MLFEQRMKDIENDVLPFGFIRRWSKQTIPRKVDPMRVLGWGISDKYGIQI